MKKVLVVDDNVDLLSVVQILLGINNYSVETISRWQDIAKTIDSFLPDLILLDVALSGADGCIICKQLKQSHRTQHIPVILFSAQFDLANNISECMADGLVQNPLTSFLYWKQSVIIYLEAAFKSLR